MVENEYDTAQKMVHDENEVLVPEYLKEARKKAGADTNTIGKPGKQHTNRRGEFVDENGYIHPKPPQE